MALVDLARRRLLATLPARGSPETDALAFFPDGRTLVTGGLNGRVTFWNVANHAPERTLRFADPVHWTAVSGDGRLIAVQTQARGARQAAVEVREAASGALRYRRTVPTGAGGLQFSPDGRRLAALGCCGAGAVIEAWAARTGRELFRRRVPAESIAFSPDGRFLGVGTSDGNLVRYDAGTGRQSGPPIPVAAEGLNSIAFSRDGRLFAAGSDDQTTTLVDLRSRKPLGRTFPVTQGVIPATAFTADGRLIVTYLAEAAVWPTSVGAWSAFACRAAGRDLTRSEWTALLPDRPYRPVCR